MQQISLPVLLSAWWRLVTFICLNGSGNQPQNHSIQKKTDILLAHSGITDPVFFGASSCSTRHCGSLHFVEEIKKFVKWEYFGHKISSEERLRPECGDTIKMLERNCETWPAKRSISFSAE